jgi:hypothetical protein
VNFVTKLSARLGHDNKTPAKGGHQSGVDTIIQSLRRGKGSTVQQVYKYLTEMLERLPDTEEEYVYPSITHDQLFEATYNHKGEKTCQLYDRNKVVERALRKNSAPRIHYGTIGSTNKVIKDSETKDKLRKDLGILCVEMEAADLMDEFFCYSWHLRLCRLAQEQSMAALCYSYCRSIEYRIHALRS